jgi:hypothetical protein
MIQPEWSKEHKLAAMLHGLGSRLWKARLAIDMYEHRQDGTWPYPNWEYRYRDDVRALLIRLGYPEWADAPSNTCCQSACCNPAIHDAQSSGCRYDPPLTTGDS